MNKSNDKTDEVLQLEKLLTTQEIELQARYCQLGKQLLALAEDEQRRIDLLVDGIIDTHKKLVLAKHEIECPDCTTFNTEDSRYCKRCGTPLTPQAKRPDFKL